MHAYARFAGKDIVHCTCAIGTVTVLEQMAARGRDIGTVLTHFMVHVQMVFLPRKVESGCSKLKKRRTIGLHLLLSGDDF